MISNSLWHSFWPLKNRRKYLTMPACQCVGTCPDLPPDTEQSGLQAQGVPCPRLGSCRPVSRHSGTSASSNISNPVYINSLSFCNVDHKSNFFSSQYNSFPFLSNINTVFPTNFNEIIFVTIYGRFYILTYYGLGVLMRFLMLKCAVEDLQVVSTYNSITKKHYAVGKITLKELSLVCFAALHNKIRAFQSHVLINSTSTSYI